MKMKNVLAALALGLGLQAGGAAAFPFPIESVITGADMAGMEVTVTFEDLSTDTAVWETTSTDGSVAFGEGFAGAAAGSSWSLYQQGFTFGNNVGGTPLGLWSFTNFSASPTIMGFTVNAITGFTLFDIVEDVEVTPGSQLGRAFLTELDDSLYTVSYGNQLADDLFGSLTVGFTEGLEAGSVVQFFIDTDGFVPSPGTLALLATGLIFAGSRRKHGRA